MMDNIESVLKNFFFRMSSDKIIETHICGDAIGKTEFLPADA